MLATGLHKRAVTAVDFIKKPYARRVVVKRNQIHGAFVEHLYGQNDAFTPRAAVCFYRHSIVNLHTIPHYLRLPSVYYKTEGDGHHPSPAGLCYQRSSRLDFHFLNGLAAES